MLLLEIKASSRNATSRLLHDTFADTRLNPHAAIALLTGTLYLTDTIVVSHSVGITMTTSRLRTDHALFFANTYDVVAHSPLGVILYASVYSSPRFVEPAADNYHLLPISPAIDAGVDAGVTTDIDGEPRPLGAGFDIGFDEAPVRKVWLPLVVR